MSVPQEILEALLPQYQSLILFLKAEKERANTLNKPLSIISAESHYGFEEFSAKLLLAYACTALGIRHHCIERNPSDIADALASTNTNQVQLSESDGDFLFYHLLLGLKVDISEVDRANDDDDPQELLHSNISLEDKKLLLPLNRHYLEGRNFCMSQAIINDGRNSVLYTGLAHAYGLYHLLKENTHCVIIDVSHLLINSKELNDIFVATKGIPVADEFPWAAFYDEMVNYRIRIPLKASEHNTGVIELKSVDDGQLKADPTGQCFLDIFSDVSRMFGMSPLLTRTQKYHYKDLSSKIGYGSISIPRPISSQISSIVSQQGESGSNSGLLLQWQKSKEELQMKHLVGEKQGYGPGAMVIYTKRR